MSIAPQIQTKRAGSKRNVAVTYVEMLDAGELLTGTPTVTEVTTSDLTLASKAVSTAALTILGETVAIGQAVQFTVAGGTAGTRYTIRCTCDTDGGQTGLEVDLLLDVT